MIKKNIGCIDRMLRIVVGVALLACVVVGPQTWWGLIGLVPLATAFVAFCPAYQLIGVSTCNSKK